MRFLVLASLVLVACEEWQAPISPICADAPMNVDLNSCSPLGGYRQFQLNDSFTRQDAVDAVNDVLAEQLRLSGIFEEGPTQHICASMVLSGEGLEEKTTICASRTREEMDDN